VSTPASTILATTSGPALASPVDAGNHALVLALFGIVAIVVGLWLVLLGRRRRAARRSGVERPGSRR
jgi:heme/copper-type cytochrome/quinol oxidase subunit 2